MSQAEIDSSLDRQSLPIGIHSHLNQLIDVNVLQSTDNMEKLTE